MRLLAVLLPVLTVLTGCATGPVAQSVAAPQHIDPPITVVPGATENDLWWEASLWAYPNENIYRVAPTGSMEPTLHAADYIVLEAKPWPYRTGVILGYDADWRPASEPLVLHRIYYQDEQGAVMKGDAVMQPEWGYRVTAKTAKGECVGVWRAGPKL